MPNLDASRNRALSGLIREHARLIRGLTAAKALLGLCEEKKVFPIARFVLLSIESGDQRRSGPQREIASRLRSPTSDDESPPPSV